MANLFFLYLANTMNVNVFILLLLILEPFLKKHYSSICLYRIWAILLIGLLLPVRVNIMKPLFYLGPPILSERFTDNEAVRITNTSISTDVLSSDYAPERSRTIASSSKTFFSGLINTLPEELSGILQKGYLLFCLLWLFGCSLLILVNLISFIRYQKKIKKYLFPVSQGALQDEFQRCLIEVGCKKVSTRRSYQDVMAPTLYLCPVISSPMTLGVFRPKVLLPDKSYENAELNLLIRHELVHVKRKDVLFKLILLIALSLNWFNPLCYILSKHLDIWCEASCDEIVLQQSSKSECISYGQLLLRCAATQNQQQFSFFTSFYGGKTNMKQRLLLILNRGKKSTGKILLVLFLGIVTTTVIITTDQQTKSTANIKTEAIDSSNATAVVSITPAATVDKSLTAEPTAAPSDINTTVAAAKKQDTDVPDISLTDASEVTPTADATANTDLASNTPDASRLKAEEEDTLQEPQDAALLRDEVVTIALEAESTPYAWGGNDLKESVDSSGFVQAVYMELGYELPRTSREQCAESVEVSLEELLPGDLVFYDRSDTINHVGIYIGDGQIIHASNKKVGVTIADTNYRTPKCAGRIIED